MRAPSPPPAPDPRQTAGAQTANNIGTAIANAELSNVNEVTPYGNLTYTQQDETYTYTDPNNGQVYEIPRYTVEQTFSPEMQAIFDESNRAQLGLTTFAADQTERLSGTLGENVSFDGLPQGGSASNLTAPELESMGAQDWSADRQRVEEALMSRMNPQLERDKESLRTRLLSQGIREGSVAYDRAMNRMNEQATDARMQAILAGGQEQSRLSDLEARRIGINNDAAQTGFGNQQVIQGRMDQDRAVARDETLALRNAPINEIGALLGTGQVTQPNFIQPQMPSIPTTDRAGIESDIYGQRLGAWQTQNDNRQALMGGLLGFGGNVITAMPSSMWSDRRLKRDVERVGEVDGLAVYEYRYIWGGPRHRGFMADEVAKVKPEAVVPMGDYLALDYAKLPNPEAAA